MVSRLTGGIGEANVSCDELLSLYDTRDVLKDVEVYRELIGGSSNDIHGLDPSQDRFCIIIINYEE